MRVARTVAKAASKEFIEDRSSLVERPSRLGPGFRVPASLDTHRLLSMEQRLSRIEETLAVLSRQLAALASKPTESPALSMHASTQPTVEAIGAPTAALGAPPAPCAARRALEAVLLPDLSRAEAGLRAYDTPGRRAAAVFLDGNGGQVWIYDQDGRPIHSQW